MSSGTGAGPEVAISPDTPISPVVGPRPGSIRGRRRARGPLALPGPLTADRIPRPVSLSRRFDQCVESVVATLEPQLRARRPGVDIIIDHAPILPSDWEHPVPLNSIVDTESPWQLVLFRRPHCDHADSVAMLGQLVWQTITTNLSYIWDITIDELER